MSRIAFSGNPLDRAGAKRCDSDWLAALRNRNSARILPLSALQPLLEGPGTAETAQLCFIDGDLASRLGEEMATEVFLGLDGDDAYFARDVSRGDGPPPELLALGHFRDARTAAALLPAAQVAILGQAKALIDWNNRHGFCACCGAMTAISDGGSKRVCPACSAEHFPRTDPAVIMLVTADEHCLLARNKRFAGGHYSTLAGFVEPGESIEEAVIREVFEEVAVRVGAVRYFASQPWPFPSSLMIGCFAEAETRDIAVDGTEIVSARWFDRASVKKLLCGESQDIGLPRRDAIAFHLIKEWASSE